MILCIVERKGFEPLTPAVQKRCSSQTELTPHKISIIKSELIKTALILIVSGTIRNSMCPTWIFKVLREEDSNLRGIKQGLMRPHR